MADFGTVLADARERRALTLTELSRRTKISVPILEAIERSDVDAMPTEFYARSMLRVCAREVGCNPDPIVDAFGAVLRERGIVPIQSLARLGHDDAEGQRSPGSGGTWPRGRARIQALGTGLVLTGGLVCFGYVRSDLSTAPVQPLPPAVSLKRVAVGTARTPAAPPPAPAPAPASAPRLRLDVETRGPCWVSVTADGQRVIYRLLAPGERINVAADTEIVLRLGDAGSLDYTINGAAGRSLGDAGQAVTIHLTPDNYGEFVRE